VNGRKTTKKKLVGYTSDDFFDTLNMSRPQIIKTTTSETYFLITANIGNSTEMFVVSNDGYSG
jgi:hypothetical protein